MSNLAQTIRQIMFDVIEDNFMAENEEPTEKDLLFKQAFPTIFDEYKLLSQTIDIMQFVFARVLLQLKAEGDYGFTGEEVTSFLHSMGAELLLDLESDKQQ